MSESQTDPFPALVPFSFGLVHYEAFILVDSMQPARVRLWTHNKHRIVGKWNALRRPWGPESSRVLWGLLRVLFQTKGHSTLRPEADVDDIRAPHNVYRFVGMLGDVIRTGAVELDEDMIYWVLQDFLNVFSYERNRGRERMEWR